ncbi:unannotated protein [freshwater metagenome]|uniref:Unannotated protein n=1 Tax=freshwater metagenome TaxID=449393 RepID=A0A6J6MKJ8_9ZZZZ|nr:hypothetical protein [Actinomycetota bacterium]
MEEIKESGDFIDPYQEGSGYSEEEVASMRAEMQELADVVNDEESWPAWIEAQIGTGMTPEEEKRSRSRWLSFLEDERDHPLMTDLDTSPEFW